MEIYQCAAATAAAAALNAAHTKSRVLLAYCSKRIKYIEVLRCLLIINNNEMLLCMFALAFWFVAFGFGRLRQKRCVQTLFPAHHLAALRNVRANPIFHFNFVVHRKSLCNGVFLYVVDGFCHSVAHHLCSLFCRCASTGTVVHSIDTVIQSKMWNCFGTGEFIFGAGGRGVRCFCCIIGLLLVAIVASCKLQSLHRLNRSGYAKRWENVICIQLHEKLLRPTDTKNKHVKKTPNAATWYENVPPFFHYSFAFTFTDRIILWNGKTFSNHCNGLGEQ